MFVKFSQGVRGEAEKKFNELGHTMAKLMTADQRVALGDYVVKVFSDEVKQLHQAGKRKLYPSQIAERKKSTAEGLKTCFSKVIGHVLHAQDLMGKLEVDGKKKRSVGRYLGTYMAMCFMEVLNEQERKKE